MRTACLILTATLAAACGDDGNMTSSQSSPTSDPTGNSTGNDSASETGTPGTTGTPTTGDPTADSETSPTTGSGGDNLMTNYGAPCMTDADCKALIDPSAICIMDILGVYTLPGGYCSNNCAMPMDGSTTFVKGAPDCFLGADCVGLDGYFEACGLECTDNSQCPRMGYECRRMPTISQPGDPKYCLMTDEFMN